MRYALLEPINYLVRPATRVESGCSSLKIVGPPHQTQKVVGRLAKVQLEFGCYPVPLRRTYNTT